MILLLSPAKTLNLNPTDIEVDSLPAFKTQAFSLIKELRKYSREEIKNLMHVSDALAEENWLRYKSFRKEPYIENTKQAILTFSGDVYRGLDASSLSAEDITFAQNRIFILSGLYGILRPLDRIQPYRLEMGAALQTEKGKNLYEFWGDRLTHAINKAARSNGHTHIVNLASKEYMKAVNQKKLKPHLVDIMFKEYRGDKLSFLSFNAKRARGLMARYVIDNRLDEIDTLKGFNVDGYSYAEDLSSPGKWLFIR